MPYVEVRSLSTHGMNGPGHHGREDGSDAVGTYTELESVRTAS
jgi:hypothetical protein